MKIILKTIALTAVFINLSSCVGEGEIEFAVKKNKTVDIHVTTSYDHDYDGGLFKPTAITGFTTTSTIDLTAIYDSADQIKNLELTGFSIKNKDQVFTGYFSHYIDSEGTKGYFTGYDYANGESSGTILTDDAKILGGTVTATLIKGLDDSASTETNDIQIYSGPMDIFSGQATTRTLTTPIAGVEFLDDATKKFKLKIQLSNASLYDEDFNLEMTVHTQAIAGGK